MIISCPRMFLFQICDLKTLLLGKAVQLHPVPEGASGDVIKLNENIATEKRIRKRLSESVFRHASRRSMNALRKRQAQIQHPFQDM